MTTPQLFPAMVGQWSFHFNRGEIDRSVSVGEELLRLAQQRQDLAARVMAHRALGCALLCLGKLIRPADIWSRFSLCTTPPTGSLASRYSTSTLGRLV